MYSFGLFVPFFQRPLQFFLLRVSPLYSYFCVIHTLILSLSTWSPLYMFSISYFHDMNSFLFHVVHAHDFLTVYRARSRILEQNEAKDRERYVVKFIKIMKHLRKINNFNSYLALLSALDSAPIRRLEWQKQITEGLKEYCALIDSSSSFRAYRQALAETQPPCIPYM